MTWGEMTTVTKEVAAFVAALGAIIAAYIGVVRVVAYFRVWLKNTAIVRAIHLLLEQLQKNGGKSLYDRVSQIADSVQVASNERQEIRQDIAAINANLSVVTSISMQLLDVAGEAFYLCDQNGLCTYANPTLCEMFGLSKADMIGRGWLAAIDEKERAAVWSWWQEAIKQDLPYSASYTIINQRTGKSSKARSTAERCQAGPDGVIIHVGVVMQTRKQSGHARSGTEADND